MKRTGVLLDADQFWSILDICRCICSKRSHESGCVQKSCLVHFLYSSCPSHAAATSCIDPMMCLCLQPEFSFTSPHLHGNDKRGRHERGWRDETREARATMERWDEGCTSEDGGMRRGEQRCWRDAEAISAGSRNHVWLHTIKWSIQTLTAISVCLHTSCTQTLFTASSVFANDALPVGLQEIHLCLHAISTSWWQIIQILR